MSSSLPRSPPRAGARGLSAQPIESADKGAICHLFSAHESLEIFFFSPPKSTCDPCGVSRIGGLRSGGEELACFLFLSAKLPWHSQTAKVLR